MQILSPAFIAIGMVRSPSVQGEMDSKCCFALSALGGKNTYLPLHLSHTSFGYDATIEFAANLLKVYKITISLSSPSH